MEMFDRVGAEMGAAVQDMQFPGLVWSLTSGHDAGRQVALEAPGDVPGDALIRIASVTKPIAAAATLALTEAGVLDLDDPVERFVPSWAGRRVLGIRNGPLSETVPADRPTTVRDLLAMGFGLGYDAGAPEGDALSAATSAAGLYSDWRVPALDPDTWAERAAVLPMAHQPGQGWLYQSSFDALTVVVQAATGQGFEAVLRERILDPLGMAETGFTVPEESLDRVPRHGFPDAAGGPAEILPAGDRALLTPPRFPSAATGLVSTAADLMRFASMLLDGGSGPNRRVLTEDSVRAMTTETTTGAGREMGRGLLPEGQAWGLGVGIDPAGRFGWDGGTGSSLWVDPAAGVAGVLLTTEGMGSPEPPAYLQRFWRAVQSLPT
ncbi:serine hydrolase domain-containing protein [Citricoccus nitrophenolicus]|uniref:serine hydrolase domain-containing protein n=1 Tax=Citricoccus nitrophenolicus TaxID=863575 RepID=UPI0039B6CA8E